MPVKAANSSQETYDFASLRRVRRFRTAATHRNIWQIGLRNTNTDEESTDEWDEIEQLGPEGQQLIRLVSQFPAPYDWD